MEFMGNLDMVIPNSDSTPKKVKALDGEAMIDAICEGLGMITFAASELVYSTTIRGDRDCSIYTQKMNY